MSTDQPTFADIVTLLNTLFAADPNIGRSPHKAFWQNTARDNFVAIQTGAWGAEGSLVGATPAASTLYLALAGQPPFDGFPPRMPDIKRDPAGRHATDAELQMVATWITAGAPA
jgi:hypothetical protein